MRRTVTMMTRRRARALDPRHTRFQMLRRRVGQSCHKIGTLRWRGMHYFHACNLAYACISIGQRIPVLGVIYYPFLEHIYKGRARRRLLSTHPHHCTRFRHRHRHRNRVPTTPSARTSKRAAAALAGRCAHCGQVGFGPHTSTNMS